MKTAKKILAIFLSAILIMGILPCSVFADSIPEELICDGYFDYSSTYKYCGVMSLGDNTAFDVETNTAYFFTFTPDQTGVYGFAGNIKGITGDTDDDRCRVDEFEDLITLYPEGYESYTDFSFLTQGKTYYILVDYFEGVTISYEGAVTDVEPTAPFTDLVKGWDITSVNSDVENGIALDVELAVTFSSNKTLYGWGFYFGPGNYTENTVTWKHLGVEKTFRYSVIDIKDMVSSVTAKNKVEFIRYFDDRIEFTKPVTLVVDFGNGQSTEVVIEDYDYYYSFTATNGRVYRIYLDINEDGELAAWIAGSEFGSIDYTMKRVGFFKDLFYYVMCLSTIRLGYHDMMKGQPLSIKSQLLLESFKETGGVSIDFLKSLFVR